MYDAHGKNVFFTTFPKIGIQQWPKFSWSERVQVELAGNGNTDRFLWVL